MTTAPDKFFDVRITSRVDFADDLWMIRVAPTYDFHFAPGQYATLGVDNGSGLVERAYSIASSPYEAEIEFFFELVPQGALTPLLYRLGPGDTIKARKVAKGRFTLDTATGHTNHLLLSTVTGVAPFVSYVRTLRKDWVDGTFAGEHKLFMVQGASHSRELGLPRRAGAVWRASCRGSPTSRRSAGHGTTPRGRAKRAGWTTSSASTPTCGRSTTRPRPPISAATPT